MTKKRAKRPNLPQEALERARAELRGDIVETPVAVSTNNNTGAVKAKAPKASTTTTFSRRMPTMEELHAEYDHVMKDLRKLVVVSGLIMVGIIVAALVLPAVLG
ncbi:MAG: hypothetical protein KF716_29855 [Anaerolineae bacterium]|nr:hypothetical protein [Anaerolineae bacterium]